MISNAEGGGDASETTPQLSSSQSLAGASLLSLVDPQFGGSLEADIRECCLRAQCAHSSAGLGTLFRFSFYIATVTTTSEAHEGPLDGIVIVIHMSQSQFIIQLTARFHHMCLFGLRI